MKALFEKLLEELTPVGVDLLHEALAELLTKSPDEARDEISEMARQTALVVAARKGFQRS
jgi:hypothetical protein